MSYACAQVGHIYLSAKSMRNTALFHNCIGCMSRLDFSVYCEVFPTNRAVPNVMVPSAMSYKSTTILG